MDPITAGLAILLLCPLVEVCQTWDTEVGQVKEEQFSEAGEGGITLTLEEKARLYGVQSSVNRQDTTLLSTVWVE